MKQFLKIVTIILSSVLFTSCSIDTLNGWWRTDKKEDGSFKLLNIESYHFVELEMINDSYYNKDIKGTLIAEDDTLTLFPSEDRFRKYAIKILNEDNLTLVDEKGRVHTFTRKYKDISNKTAELIEYKYGKATKDFYQWIYDNRGTIVPVTIYIFLGVFCYFIFTINDRKKKKEL